MPLDIYNTSESDSCIYEVSKAVAKKAQKKSEASTGFEPMTSAIPVQCSNIRPMKPCWKQVKCEFNLYPLYEESEMMCI